MNVYGFDITYWVYQTIAMMVTCFLIPKLKVSGPIPALATVIVLAFVNSHWWNAALFLSIPTTLSSQTLMLLGVNGVIFWIVVKVLPGIEVEGILPAIAAPVVFTICSVFIAQYGATVNWSDVYDRSSQYIGQVRSHFEEEKASSSSGEQKRSQPQHTSYDVN